MQAPGAAAQQAEVALHRKLSTRKGKQGSEVQRKRRPVLENANRNVVVFGNESMEQVVLRSIASNEHLITSCQYRQLGAVHHKTPIGMHRYWRQACSLIAYESENSNNP